MSTSNKPPKPGANISFDDLPPATPQGPATPAQPMPSQRRPSGVGLVSSMVETARNVVAENGIPIRLDPNIIEVTEWADRDPSFVDTHDFLELKESIRLSEGNVAPIKVRVVTGEGGRVRYQLVYGRRRLMACQLLKLRVKCVVEKLDGDRALYLQMVGENRGRVGLSPWEQGMSYHRATRGDAPLFASVAELVMAAGLDHSNVSKAMRIAELPHEIISVFKHPTDITFRLGKALVDAYGANPKVVLEAAKGLHGKPGVAPEDLVKTLTTTKRATPTQAATRRPLALPGGKKGEIRLGSGGAVQIQLARGVVPADRLQWLQRSIEELIRTMK